MNGIVIPKKNQEGVKKKDLKILTKYNNYAIDSVQLIPFFDNKIAFAESD